MHGCSPLARIILLRIAGAQEPRPENEVSAEQMKAAKLAVEQAKEKSKKLKEEIKSLMNEMDTLRERDDAHAREQLAQIEQLIPKLAEEEKRGFTEYAEANKAYMQCAEGYIATPAKSLEEARRKAECATTFFMEVNSSLQMELVSENQGQQVSAKVWREDSRLAYLERQKKIVKKRVNEYEMMAKKEGVEPEPLPFWPQRDLIDEREAYKLTTKVYKNVRLDFFCGEDCSTPEAVLAFLRNNGVILSDQVEGTAASYNRKQKTITLTGTPGVQEVMKNFVEVYRKQTRKW